MGAGQSGQGAMMCHAELEPKFLLREVEARLGYSARAAREVSLQDRDKSAEIPPLRLAALRVWWQSRAKPMLRKDVPFV